MYMKKILYLIISVLVIGCCFGCENNKKKVEDTEETGGNYIVSKTDITIGSTVPKEAKLRKTAELAMKDWEDIIGKKGETRPFYIKLDINESKEVIASYIEFVINDSLKKEWKKVNCSKDKECEAKYDNLVNGTYTLKGGDSGESYDDNINVIKKAFNYEKQPSLCNDGGLDFYCNLKGLYAYARGFGDINVSDENNSCHIYSDGISHCE